MSQNDTPDERASTPRACNHEWVSSLRPDIVQGEWCRYCGVLRSLPPSTAPEATPEQAPTPAALSAESPLREAWSALHTAMEALGVSDKAPLVVAITRYGEVWFKQGRYGATPPLAPAAQRDEASAVAALRALSQVQVSKAVKALAAIVNVSTPDKIYDLDAIPREPVMTEVGRIRDAVYALAALATSPRGNE